MKTQLAKLWRLLALPKNIQLQIMRVLQDEFLVGVTGIIFNDKNEVLICKHTYRQTVWSLPGGYLKGKEDPREGLAREIEEETGFKVRVERIIRTSADRDTARLDLSCIGTLVGGTFRPSTEVSEAQFLSIDKLTNIPENQQKLVQEVLKRKNGNPFWKKVTGFFR